MISHNTVTISQNISAVPIYTVGMPVPDPYAGPGRPALGGYDHGQPPSTDSKPRYIQDRGGK